MAEEVETNAEFETSMHELFKRRFYVSPNYIHTISLQEGNEAFKHGKYETAVEKYSEALSVDEDNVRLTMIRNAVLSNSPSFTDIQKDFNAMVYCNRAAALMKLNKLEEAVEVERFSHDISMSAVCSNLLS